MKSVFHGKGFWEYADKSDERGSMGLAQKVQPRRVSSYSWAYCGGSHALVCQGIGLWTGRGFLGTGGAFARCGLGQYPEEHCKKAPELLEEIHAEPEMVRAICSHGYGLVTDIEPEHQMEKVLYAVDELTGLVGAAAKMRPSKSVQDMEVSSLKKKFKDKRFAAGCSRDVIRKGAEMLGWELTELFEKTILAMRSCEEQINQTDLS